jgi:hypothetical protein
MSTPCGGKAVDMIIHTVYVTRAWDPQPGLCTNFVQAAAVVAQHVSSHGLMPSWPAFMATYHFRAPVYQHPSGPADRRLDGSGVLGVS